MKRWIGKETAPLPVSEQEAAQYIELAFLSRFFSESVSREEAQDWIASHFPVWPEEGQRSAEQALLQARESKEGRPGRLSLRKWWRHSREGERSNGHHPNGPKPFDSPDQRLLLLAKGYWYTGEEKYRRALFEETSRYFSPRSWGSRRDAGLPLWKGVWLLRFTAGMAAPEELMRLWQTLMSHAAKESRKRESPERGLFLLMMGTLFPESPEARGWKSRGSAMLERELFRRVGRDGVCRSKTLSDQINLLQLYLQAILIGRRYDPFPDRVEQRVERMLEFLSVQAQTPLLAERGRPRSLFTLSAVEQRPLEKTLGLGAIVFHRSDWKGCGGCFSEEAFFLTGPAGYQFHQEEAAPSHGGSLLFEEAGYALLRSRTTDEKAMVVRSAPPGPSPQEGSLALSIAAPGRLFLKDPSIHVEREEAKGVLRTVSKNGGSHSPWSRAFLGEEVDYVEGEQPVDQSAPSCKQKRSVLFIKPDYWMIHDLFLGEGIVGVDWRLPFVPQAKIEGNLADGFHITAPDGRLWLAALGTHLKGIDARVQRTEKQVVVRSGGPLPISLTTLLYPDSASSVNRYDFKSLYFPSIEGGSAFEVLTSTHTDTFLFAPPRGRLALSHLRFEGGQLFVRRDYLGEISRLFALSGRFCYWEGKRLFESAQPIPFLEMSYRGEVLHVRGTLSGPISFYADGVEEVQVNGEKTYFTRDRDRLILHF